jgi:hypothetical protein
MPDGSIFTWLMMFSDRTAGQVEWLGFKTEPQDW